MDPRIVLVLLLLSPLTAAVVAESSPECDTSNMGECYDRPKALKLKVIAIATILVASMIGICLPLFSRSVPALSPDRNLFFVVKAFASGSSSPRASCTFCRTPSRCCNRRVCRAIHGRSSPSRPSSPCSPPLPPSCWTPSPCPSTAAATGEGGGNGRRCHPDGADGLRRLELGIVVHSIVIGLSMGASQNPCTIRPLVAALCFHQFFEGMGLGGCILQAEYGFGMKAIMVFFFATTTPFGVALGIGLSNVYSDNSPTALMVIGLLNASSSGLLIYMALVDLLAADFLGHKLQSNVKLQGWGYVAVLLGIGGMSLMAKWA
ncbi:unnamed protein product [Spirodela intermedia]|uniref:Uncharacterized protein n=1 Tax=Spirodela intermedia TaxID=51605 RepID=A0A7I8IKZ7_SPIIN|nr:unnamed protein product [Spirodela intermedia]CAA6658063.1 unnamed protein product [Spirodela intermedia]